MRLCLVDDRSCQVDLRFRRVGVGRKVQLDRDTAVAFLEECAVGRRGRR